MIEGENWNSNKNKCLFSFPPFFEGGGCDLTTLTVIDHFDKSSNTSDLFSLCQLFTLEDIHIHIMAKTIG